MRRYRWTSRNATRRGARPASSRATSPSPTAAALLFRSTSRQPGCSPPVATRSATSTASGDRSASSPPSRSERALGSSRRRRGGRRRAMCHGRRSATSARGWSISLSWRGRATGTCRSSEVPARTTSRSSIARSPCRWECDSTAARRCASRRARRSPCRASLSPRPPGTSTMRRTRCTATSAPTCRRPRPATGRSSCTSTRGTPSGRTSTSSAPGRPPTSPRR